MSGRRSQNNSVANGRVEDAFDFRDMLIARYGPKAIPGNPKIDVRRFNFRDLSKPAGRPMQFDPANDERSALNCLGPLMLKGRGEAIAEHAQRDLALRRIDLLLLVL